MGLSKVRANVPDKLGQELDLPPEPDMKIYEVFIQTDRGKPHVHAGSINAADNAMAIQFACEHYGRDERCVQVWAVPRDAIVSTDYDKDLVFRLTDQSYRFAKGYNVGQKWRQFREAKAVEDYEKEDIKEFFQ